MTCDDDEIPGVCERCFAGAEWSDGHPEYPECERCGHEYGNDVRRRCPKCESGWLFPMDDDDLYHCRECGEEFTS